MKLKSSWGFGTAASQRTYDVSDAVELTLARSGERSGVAEQAAAHADACGNMIGRIVQMLHEKGALTEDNVLELVSGFVKAEA